MLRLSFILQYISSPLNMTLTLTHTQVYPIGIPLVFFILLFRKRRLINPSKEVHPDIMSLSGGNAGGNYGSSEGDGEPDPRLLDRRIAQTAFLWGVG